VSTVADEEFNTIAFAAQRSMGMENLKTFLSGTALGVGSMYLMDPDCGYRRRGDLRGRLAEVGESRLDRARHLHPLAVAGEIGAGILKTRWPVAAALLLGGRRTLPFTRRRPPMLAPRWALVAGIAATIGGGALWLLWHSKRGGHGIEMVRRLTVEAPVDRVFEFWNDFENFPRFMSHVREIRFIGADRTRWVVNGPEGTPVEWEALVTHRVPPTEITWRTVEGGLVDHEGSVRLRPAGKNATRIKVRMTYRPMDGALRHEMAALFGGDPKRVIAGDMARLAAELPGGPAVGKTASGVGRR